MPFDRASKKYDLKTKAHRTSERQQVAAVHAGPVCHTAFAGGNRKQEQANHRRENSQRSPAGYLSAPEKNQEQGHEHHRKTGNKRRLRGARQPQASRLEFIAKPEKSARHQPREERWTLDLHHFAVKDDGERYSSQ